MSPFRFLGVVPLVLALVFVGPQASASSVTLTELATIQGEATGEEWGSSVALSDDGSVIVAGAPKATVGVDSERGVVRVFTHSAGVLTQRGTSLSGEAAGDYFGSAVAINSDGTVIAVGAPSNAAGGVNRGHVRVFAWSGSAWVQRGSDLDGVDNFEQFGSSVDLSADGTRVVIGGPLRTAGGTSGIARVYEWNGTAWVQVGSSIVGASGNQLGGAVSISDDGVTIALGARARSSNTGGVFVYTLSGGTWVQVGSTLTGTASGDYFGWSVDLNSAGDIVAIGAPYTDSPTTNSGSVLVYRNVGGTWTQQGATVEGQDSGGRLGIAVSLSNDGTQLVSGAPIADSSTGKVRSFTFSGGAWVSRVDALAGSAVGDEFGGALSLSGDGQTIAVGAKLHDNPGTSAGQVRLFRYLTPSTDIGGVSRPGIYLQIAGPVGRSVEGSPVYYGAYKVMPHSAYSLTMRSSAPGSKTQILDQGAVSAQGHVERRFALGAVSPGQYTVRFLGTHASGTGLRLVATITVGNAGEYTLISDNVPGIW